MTNNRLKYLYQQYIDNQCNDEELQELKQLLAQQENEPFLAELMDNTWEEVQNTPLADVSDVKADEVFLSVTAQPQIRRKPGYLGLSLAAVLLLAAAFGLYFYMFGSGRKQAEFTAVKTASAADKLLPGSSKAVLTLENGRKIVLDDTRNGEVVIQKSAVIHKVAGGLVYAATTTSTLNTTLYNAITVPRGGQYKVTLADGTLVFLNSESELTYPAKFSGAARTVTLKGEAYFEVAKNPKMPFKVNVAGKQQIEVLGTHFNVAAYADETAVKTTLLEGLVRLYSPKNQLILQPGQTAINNPAKNIVIKEADVNEVMAWKNGEFVFNNENIRSIMQQVSRWYNVNVVFEGNLDEINFTGNYSRAKSLSTLLKNIELINKIHFKKEGRRITVMAI
ncbi:MAG: FecR family protein [Sphingobacteriaceae bacterium]|nr:MAG: FecR family protein [Sphingobacteriaceae bacterium]